MNIPPMLPRQIRAAVLLLPAVLFLSGQQGCETMQQKRHLEALKNTVACKLLGERVVILFQDGDARILMPDATRVTLYQIPTTSGLRYSNGNFELRGRGMDLTLIRDAGSIPLTECAPYAETPAAK